MNPELKPCPFCGGRAYLARTGTYKQSSIVECESCGCCLETGEEGDQCGTAWNRRAQVEPVTTRRAFICTSCEGVYADEAVSQCDCVPERDEFIEGTISYPATQPATDSAGYTLGPISDGGMDPRSANDRQARGEPVLYQSRTRPIWVGASKNWTAWENCTKDQANDYKRVKVLHDWEYEVRELYTAPQPQQIPGGYRLQPISEFDAMMDTRTIPEGYKIVPIEPTVEMLLAGDAEFGKRKIPSISGICYKAMLDAAPKGVNSIPPLDDESDALTIAYMLGLEDGKKYSHADAICYRFLRSMPMGLKMLTQIGPGEWEEILSGDELDNFLREYPR